MKIKIRFISLGMMTILSICSIYKLSKLGRVKEVETKEEITVEQPEEKIEVKKLQDTYDNLNYEKKLVVKALSRIYVKKSPLETSSSLGLLGLDQELDFVNNVDNDWIEVNYKDQTGYVLSSQVSIDEKYQVKDSIKQIGYFPNEASLYKDIDKENKTSDIPKYAEADIYDEDATSYLVESEGKIGFVSKQDVKKLNDTYVIVDITEQKLRMYENNELLLETPVVTGKNNVTDTPIGKYTIGSGKSDITLGRWLMNEDGTRNVWVDTMMKFNGNIGLHDAEYHNCKNGSHGWRGTNEFNPYTYLTNGSHGCVNMLHDSAMQVYDTVKSGDAVLVKR